MVLLLFLFSLPLILLVDSFISAAVSVLVVAVVTSSSAAVAASAAVVVVASAAAAEARVVATALCYWSAVGSFRCCCYRKSKSF